MFFKYYGAFALNRGYFGKDQRFFEVELLVGEPLIYLNDVIEFTNLLILFIFLFISNCHPIKNVIINDKIMIMWIKAFKKFTQLLYLVTI